MKQITTLVDDMYEVIRGEVAGMVPQAVSLVMVLH